jgi:hypothetical protein
MVMLFFVPVVNLATICMLCLVPEPRQSHGVATISVAITGVSLLSFEVSG